MIFGKVKSMDVEKCMFNAKTENKTLNIQK